jgi:hypothetical protein
VSVVREELGPSLPQLVAPHWGRLSHGRRVALLAAAIVLLVVLALGYVVLKSDPLKVTVIREPVAFNLVHRADFGPVTPAKGELLRLEGVLPGVSGARESFAVRPLTIPPYRGDVSSAYLAVATRRLAALRAADPEVRYRGEGRARVNTVTVGYQLTYQTRRAGKLVYGKIFFLAPEPADGEPQSRQGAELALLAERSGQTPTAAAVGSDVLLKSPLRSFRFGTERP